MMRLRSHLWPLSMLLLGGSVTCILIISVRPNVHAQSSYMPEQCRQYMRQSLKEEREAYRRVQYGDAYPSVLHTNGAQTSGLVDYLAINYHALQCRLRSVCDSIELSYHPFKRGTVLPHRPIGCSRLFAARGRWWSDERRELGFNSEVVPACDYFSLAETDYPHLTMTSFNTDIECNKVVDQILEEEQQMLRMITAQDAVYRGTQSISNVFQTVISDVRESFLMPLRGLVDLFGSVIYPIPCLVTQCN